jgi:SAM-dependent methyltransferase
MTTENQQNNFLSTTEAGDRAVKSTQRAAACDVNVAKARLRPFRTLPKRLARRSFRVLYNVFMDVKYGGFTGGRKVSPFGNLGAKPTQSAEYTELAYQLAHEGLKVNDSDVLVDLGCGKGRVINFWLELGVGKRLVGIELDREIAEQARRRLSKHRKVEIISGDVLAHLPNDGTIFFTYNFADADVMEKVRDALYQIAHDHNIVFVYYVSHHLSVFEADDRWDIETMTMPSTVQAAIIRPRKALINVNSTGADSRVGAGLSRDR